MPDGSREEIIHETEFARVFADRAREFLRYLNLLVGKNPNEWGKRHFYELMDRAHDTETLLDDYDARNNKAFSLTTELVASLRGFALVAIAQQHFLSRLPRYNVSFGPDEQAAFQAESERTAAFLGGSILRLVHELWAELERHGVQLPADARADWTVAGEGHRKVLPHNIDEEDVGGEEKRIAEVASKYLSANDQLSWARNRRVGSAEKLRDFVLLNVEEEKARHYESLVHSIQSKYDTYIKATTLEAQTPSLPRLRGHVSLALHLLEMGTQLVHFYERHENDIRCESTKSRIAELIDKAALLDRVVNFVFFYASRVMLAGKRFAEETLAQFVSVQRLEVDIPEGATLHARPISLIVKVVQHYGTHVEMEIDGESCSAGSIMQMIMMVGRRPHARRLVFRGDSRPLADVKLLFENGMGERGLEDLPAQLAYLKTG